MTAGPRGLSPCPPSPSKSSRSEASPRPACCTWRPVCLPGLAGPPALGGGGPGTASGCFWPRRQLGLRTRGGRWKEPGGTGPQSCIQALAALAAALGCADSCPFRGCRCPCSRQPALLSWASAACAGGGWGVGAGCVTSRRGSRAATAAAAPPARPRPPACHLPERRRWAGGPAPCLCCPLRAASTRDLSRRGGALPPTWCRPGVGDAAGARVDWGRGWRG